jgi:hypothetical protein
LKQCVCNRRSAIASTGRIGLVSERARPVGNYYTLIGEAYIYGAMEGEAIEMLDEGNFKLQDFIM